MAGQLSQHMFRDIGTLWDPKDIHHHRVWWCTCKLLSNTTLSTYTTLGARSAPGVVYIQTAVFYSSLHIHHQIVHTSHFPIFSRPQPGGGVYLWGPNLIRQIRNNCVTKLLFRVTGFADRRIWFICRGWGLYSDLCGLCQTRPNYKLHVL